MSDNMYEFKCKAAPNDYLNGSVRVFTPQEIADWESNMDPVIQRKIQEAQSMDEVEIKALDALALLQAEDDYSQIMEGVNVVT